MTGSRFLGLVLLLASTSMSVAQRRSTSSSDISLVSAIVQAGSPELIRVNAPGATLVTGEWLGQNIQFFRSGDMKSWFALAGVDVEAPPGASKLKVKVVSGPDTANF